MAELTSVKPVQDMLQLQYDGLARQDEQLDRVERGVARVQTQAEAIHGEVTEQTQLIESLDYDVEHVQSRLDSVRRRVEHVLTRMNRKLYYFTCFAVPFATVLILMYLLKHL
jgi:t-SNARE complex subunit (syntaxin)